MLSQLPALAPPDYGSYAQVVVDEGIKIVETAGRAPDQFIKLFKENNILVIHKCVAIRHALSAERLGVDAVRQPLALLLYHAATSLLADLFLSNLFDAQISLDGFGTLSDFAVGGIRRGREDEEY